MLRILFATLLLLATPFGSMAQEAGLHAGVMRVTLGGMPAFDALYWYPTQVPESPWEAGPFTMPATRNAPPAEGIFPLVLLSHGGGLSGGTPLLLRELAASLARQGFIVVAPFHGKAGLAERAGQMVRVRDAVLSDPRLARHIDGTKIGMIGFSLGTAVTLELAGAVPNPDHLAAYCARHAQDVMSCAHAPDGRNAPEQAVAAEGRGAQALSPPPKAIVLLDPYAVLFQAPELKAVTMPVLIFRPSESALPAEPNVAGLAAALPQAPDVRSIPGGHFVFADVCPASLSAGNPEICADPAGVDRAAVHRAVEAQVGAFLRQHL